MCWTGPCSVRTSASSEIPLVCPLSFPQDAAVVRNLPCPEGNSSDLLERCCLSTPLGYLQLKAIEKSVLSDAGRNAYGKNISWLIFLLSPEDEVPRLRKYWGCMQKCTKNILPL